MPMSGRIPVFVGICGQSCMYRGSEPGLPGWPGCRNPQRSRRSRRPGRRPTSGRAATARPSRRPAVRARGRSGARPSAAKWAHSAMALAVRALGRGEGGAVDPRAVLTMVERVMREGDVRRGAVGADLGPDDARGAAARLAGGHRPAPRRRRPARAAAARGLQPRRPLPPRPARARAQAGRRGRRRPRRHDQRRRPRRRRGRPLRRLRGGHPVRAGGRLPRPREGQARPARGRPAARRAGGRRRRRRCTA